MKAHYRDKPEKRSPDKHATPWHKAVAEAGTILLTEVGSSLHGTSVSEYDDLDLMGICIEPPDAVIGYKSFEQYEWKTAWERPGERANRSGPGDVDKTVYSLRKWMRLAMNGNPTVLNVFFTPRDKIKVVTNAGEELLGRMPKYVLSSKAGDRFIGYLKTQRECMLSHYGKGRDCTRPELIEKYGFDTKFAGHMIRLGFQGAELMDTGKITLPMPPSERQVVTDIRTGKATLRECLDLAEQLEHDLKRFTETSPLRPEPDYEIIDRWLCETYQWNWTLASAARIGSEDYKPEPY
jgi:hypothetical protein